MNQQPSTVYDVFMEMGHPYDRAVKYWKALAEGINAEELTRLLNNYENRHERFQVTTRRLVQRYV